MTIACGSLFTIRMFRETQLIAYTDVKIAIDKQLSVLEQYSYGTPFKLTDCDLNSFRGTS